MMVTCPKCRFEQEGGEECLRCGIIFRKYKPPPKPGAPESPGTHAEADLPAADEPVLRLRAEDSQGDANPAESEDLGELVFEGEGEPEKKPPSRGVVRSVLRIFPWISLVATLGALYLIVQQSPPIEVKMDPRAMERVDRKMRELQFAAQTGRPYTLSLDEAELNAWLQANLALASGSQGTVSGYAPNMNVPTDDPEFQEAQSALKDIRVNLSGDTLRAYALFNIRGRDISLLLEGRIRVQDGYLRFEPTSGKLGSLPIPMMTLDHVVDRLFDSPQNRENFQVSSQISTVDIRHGNLFVAYQ